MRDTVVVINSCWRRVSGSAGDIRAPNVAKAWKSASGMSVRGHNLGDAFTGVVDGDGVFRGIQRALACDGALQPLAAFGERKRFHPGHCCRSCNAGILPAGLKVPGAVVFDAVAAGRRRAETGTGSGRSQLSPDCARQERRGLCAT